MWVRKSPPRPCAALPAMLCRGGGSFVSPYHPHAHRTPPVERLNLTAVNLNLTGVRLNLTAERLYLTAVNLDPTGVRLGLSPTWPSRAVW
jgi:hypothetical protein